MKTIHFTDGSWIKINSDTTMTYFGEFANQVLSHFLKNRKVNDMDYKLRYLESLTNLESC